MRVLARLLYAYATVRGTPLKHADEVINTLFKATETASAELEDDVIETHIYQTLEMYEAIHEKQQCGGDLTPASGTLFNAIERIENYEIEEKRGTLYVTSAASLLSAMRAKQRRPKGPAPQRWRHGKEA